MFIRSYLAASLIFSLSSLAAAISGENIGGNTLNIIVNGDTIKVTIESTKGDIKTVKITDWDFLDEKNIPGDETGLPLEISNELIIDGDRIIIDGQEFNSDEIENLSFSGVSDKGFRFKAKFPYKEYEFSQRKVVSASKHNANDRFSFNGLTISNDEVIHGDAVSITGDVTVHGEVLGDIVSVFGDVILYEGSFTGGDVVAPFGKVIKKGTAVIKGDPLPKKSWHKHSNKTDFDMSARYNRVEGFTLLAGIHYEDKDQELPELDFNAGYAFALKRWDFDIGFRQEFGNNWPFYFGGNLYQGAVTQDEWIFTRSENTIASLIFKEDYHDFYFRKGIKGYIGQKLGEYAFAQLEYTGESHEVLMKNTNWAIFGGKKKFRDNYSIVSYDQTALAGIDGDLRMLGLRLGWDSRNSEVWPVSGQHAELLWQSAGNGIVGDLSGDHSYDIVQATVSHYQRLTGKQHLGIRLNGGHSDQQLPLDRWMFLGGVGSLRGYDYKEFNGNRYAMGNLDYYFEFSDDFAAVLFTDIGKCGVGEQEFKDAELKSDIGVGVIFDEDFRINIAQRLDDTDKGPVVMARFNMSF